MFVIESDDALTVIACFSAWLLPSSTAALRPASWLQVLKRPFQQTSETAIRVKRMEDPIICACGRVWQKQARTPDFSLRGRVHCRCHAVLGQDEDGSWDALLVTPRERFGAIRKLAGRTALTLLRLSRWTGIPTWRWIRLSSIAPLLSPNRARHVRVDTRVIPAPVRR
jgi:hypothetical protein